MLRPVKEQGMEASGSVGDDLLEQAVRSLARRPRVLPLTCAVRHYAWGGHDFIPELLGLEHPRPEPFAELWIGAHPVAPATVTIDGFDLPLDRLLACASDQVLGPEMSGRFAATLPYLLKILDVRAMLSIQAHPDKRQAEGGFRRENAAGVPRAAALRNYRDDNHKPEASIALTDFWMLFGFKTPEAIADTLDGVPELKPLAAGFRSGLTAADQDALARRGLLMSLYEQVMTLPQPEIDRLLTPLVTRLKRLADRGALSRESPDYWAARGSALYPLPGGHLDRGLISIYLLNLVRLEPGQGIYIPAGVLHAYLEGIAVEVMASSDNVLRGGLTPKHVDVPELLKILAFDSTRPILLGGEPISAVERRFVTPAVEFELSRLDLPSSHPHVVSRVWGADALVVIDGRADIEAGGETASLERGAAVLVPNDMAYTLRATRPATLFKVSVPHPL